MADLLEELLQGPEGLLCGICNAPLNDPVIADDDYTYCRNHIEEWFATYDRHKRDNPADKTPILSPKTGQRLKSRELKPNYWIREISDAYVNKVRELRDLRAKNAELQVRVRQEEGQREDKQDTQISKELTLQEARSMIIDLQKQLETTQLQAQQSSTSGNRFPRGQYSYDADRFQMELDQKSNELRQMTMELKWAREQAHAQEDVFQKCKKYLDSTNARRNMRVEFERELRVAADEISKLQRSSNEKVKLLAERDGELVELRNSQKEKDRDNAQLRDQLQKLSPQVQELSKQLNDKTMELQRATTQLAMRSDHGHDHRQGSHQPQPVDLQLEAGAGGAPMRNEVLLARAEAEIARLRSDMDRKERELKRAKLVAEKAGASVDLAELQQLRRVKEMNDNKVQQLQDEVQQRREANKSKDAEIRQLTTEVVQLRAASDMKEKELRSVSGRESKKVEGEMKRMQQAVDRSVSELSHERTEKLRKETELINIQKELSAVQQQLDKKESEFRTLTAETRGLVARDQLDKSNSELMKVSAELEVLQTVVKKKDERIEALLDQTIRSESDFRRVSQENRYLRRRSGDVDIDDFADKMGAQVDLFKETMGLESARLDDANELDKMRAKGEVDVLKMDALEQELRIAKDTIADLRETVQLKEREMRGLQRELDRAQELVLGTNNDELTAQIAQNDRLQAALDRRDGELRVSKEELDRLLAAAERKDASLAKADTELGRLQAEVDQREEEITKLMDEVTMLREMAQRKGDEGKGDPKRKDAAEIARLRVLLEHKEEELRIFKDLGPRRVASDQYPSESELIATVESRDALLRAAEEEKIRLQMKVERLESECKRSEEEITRLRASVDELKTAGSEFAESANVELARRTLELQTANAEIQRLQKQLGGNTGSYGGDLPRNFRSTGQPTVAMTMTNDPRGATHALLSSPARSQSPAALSSPASDGIMEQELASVRGNLQIVSDVARAHDETSDYMRDLEKLRTKVDQQQAAFQRTIAGERYTQQSNASSPGTSPNLSPVNRTPLVIDAGRHAAFSELRSPEPTSPAAVLSAMNIVQIARSGTPAQIFEILQAGNADLNRPDATGQTALQVAASRGRIEIVRCLCTGGVNVDSEDAEGRTALLLAAREGYAEVVRCLCAAGANKNLTDHYVRSPLWEAATRGHSDVVRMLSALKADSNAIDEKGVTPLQSAASQGHVATVRLLYAGGDVGDFLQDDRGRTPLYAASQAGHSEVVRILLQMEADIDWAANDGSTALTIATMHGHRDVARLLRDFREGHFDRAF